MTHGRVKRHPEELRAVAIKQFRFCKNVRDLREK